MTDQETRPETSRLKLLYPVLFAAVMAAGILIGLFLGKSGQDNRQSIFTRTQHEKVEEILNYIDQRYVDSIDKESLYHLAIEEIFRHLDPHSNYISAEELARMNEPLQGHFEGIGVEFFIVNDTITVVSALSGGPSEGLGIKAGDKIITIADSLVAGIGIANPEVVAKLKGPKGTKVKVGVLRQPEQVLQAFEITRGSVKISSIDAGYMISDAIGYLKLSRFAHTTHEDFMKTVSALKKQGMTGMILDLRDNGGGFLEQAKLLADEFIPGEEILVYTEGRSYPKKIYRGGKNGIFETGALVVIINENSASASEILAGALQDHGRATIVGRRSYGKALVQEEILLNDGAGMRLTVARYYTPKGRSIQRSYENGVEAYHKDFVDRIISEYESRDSLPVADSADYGINPEVYIHYDTTQGYKLVSKLVNRGFMARFCYAFFANNPRQFESFTSFDEFDNKFEVDEGLYKKFEAFVKSDDNGFDFESNGASQAMISAALKAYFAKQLFYYDGFYRVLNQIDQELAVTLQQF